VDIRNKVKLGALRYASLSLRSEVPSILGLFGNYPTVYKSDTTFISAEVTATEKKAT